MNAIQLIDGLGGTAVVARLARVRQPSVSEWRANGRIPDSKLIRLAVIAEQRGLAKRSELLPDWHEIWPELEAVRGESVSETTKTMQELGRQHAAWLEALNGGTRLEARAVQPGDGEHPSGVSEPVCPLCQSPLVKFAPISEPRVQFACTHCGWSGATAGLPGPSPRE